MWKTAVFHKKAVFHKFTLFILEYIFPYIGTFCWSRVFLFRWNSFIPKWLPFSFILLTKFITSFLNVTFVFSHYWQKQSSRGILEKSFLEISQENNCARVSFLIKLQVRVGTLVKKELWHRYFSVNFEKFLRKPFLQNTFGGCFFIDSLSISSSTFVLAPPGKFLTNTLFDLTL